MTIYDFYVHRYRFPTKRNGKASNIGRKVWPSKDLREFDGADKVGKPKASQHTVDIMQVEARSSMTVRWIGLPFDTTCTWNASWYER